MNQSDINNAVKVISTYYQNHKDDFDENEENLKVLNDFQTKYTPEKLQSLKDNEILDYLFLSGKKKDMIYTLEFGTNFAVGIGGGSSYIYELFYHQGENSWVFNC